MPFITAPPLRSPLAVAAVFLAGFAIQTEDLRSRTDKHLPMFTEVSLRKIL